MLLASWLANWGLGLGPGGGGGFPWWWAVELRAEVL